MTSPTASNSNYTQQPNITKQAQTLPNLHRLSQTSQNIATVAKSSPTLTSSCYIVI
ncbi:hypothetical protein L873DRAFT_1817714 [Choiromyces venosus 120613-1]|uniref:Uncharacterized protein n=1 Tax=Choiromyces venosus 120613-1 TaxID=1336337 RepID=A0A3N4IUR9_9PEZI|nr:hypothetical protein L873DRAFT_1824421 [Choiromyces venosus 120613-1]RPA92390.1 hypothetical protein L873DRAFT_1817714 [Choiromyces venosus 120613-1]